MGQASRSLNVGLLYAWHVRWAFALALAALLLAPTAGAWAATMHAAATDASLRDSLLVAGSLRAVGSEGLFGAPVADRLTFDAPVTVRHCPDQGGNPQPDGNCPGGELTHGARLYFRSGGFVAHAPQATLALDAPATAGALGGTNVTLNEFVMPPGLYVGGNATVDVEGASLALRPLRSASSIEVRGDEGFRTYNGTALTLYITGFSAATLDAHGVFVAAPDLSVTIGRAGLVPAERDLRVFDLYTLLSDLQPPEKADRRAAIPGAFGPFQFVPALLDGAAAKRTNLTLNDELRSDFAFLRLADARFAHDGGNWTGSGNATYLVEDDLVKLQPGRAATFPILVPILLVAAAITGRVLTDRGHPTKKRRALAHLTRIGGLVLLCFLAAATLTPLLGFSPLLDMDDLSLRSRVQLALLVFGMMLTSFLTVGFATESLARSAFAWRHRSRALLVPALLGIVAAGVFILLATPALLSFVARFVRL